MECAGYVLSDMSGNVRKSAVSSMEYGLWRKWQEERGKEWEGGNKDTWRRKEEIIDAVNV